MQGESSRREIGDLEQQNQELRQQVSSVCILECALFNACCIQEQSSRGKIDDVEWQRRSNKAVAHVADLQKNLQVS